MQIVDLDLFMWSITITYNVAYNSNTKNPNYCVINTVRCVILYMKGKNKRVKMDLVGKCK